MKEMRGESHRQKIVFCLWKQYERRTDGLPLPGCGGGRDLSLIHILYSKEDILFKALKVNENRVERWCQKVREPMLEKIRRMPTGMTMDQLKRAWYDGEDGSLEHYNWTRYYALNLHSVFYRGTLEWRCFESTLHAGEVRANITPVSYTHLDVYKRQVPEPGKPNMAAITRNAAPISV